MLRFVDVVRCLLLLGDVARCCRCSLWLFVVCCLLIVAVVHFYRCAACCLLVVDCYSLYVVGCVLVVFCLVVLCVVVSCLLCVGIVVCCLKWLV